MTKKRLLIGAHMSISGGLNNAFERGKVVGCTTMQIFTKNNRQWKAKPLIKDDIMLFEQTKKEHEITPLVAHATYLINIGSPNKEVEKKSIECLALELKRCNKLGIKYLVLHPGSHNKTDEQSCLDRINKNLNAIFKKDDGNTIVLLETMSGQGSSVCYTFEHIAYLLKNSKHKNRLGVCFDTCHVFAAGYDIRTKSTYEKTIQTFDEIIGLKHLKIFHINDSKKELGSRVDRHEDIGKGKIGKKAFKLLFNDEQFFDTPKILETPKEKIEDDIRNITVIKSLLSEKTKKILDIKK